MLNKLPSHHPAPVPLALRAIVLAAVLAAVGTSPVLAQAPAAAVTAPAPVTAQELEQLVGRIALYPDDLVSLILPASTNPLQIVQADRFLEERKANPKLELKADWDDAVKTLCNYPDVVKMMSKDLDWTADLGEAVVADTGEVMEAIQAFRRRAQGAGNLKTDDKQIVQVEKETVTIVPADPQVIYVPQYEPSTVVVQSAAPVYGYYPAPYPSYYYPYPPGAALATGIIWGAALGAIWNGGHYGSNWGGGGNNNINIDRSRNTNINNSGNRTGGNRAQGGNTWKSGKTPGQVNGSVNRTAGAGQNRAGDRGGAGAGGSRPNTQAAGNRGVGGGGAGGGAFDGGMGSARQTQLDSSRGASSRSSAGSRDHTTARPGGGGASAGAGTPRSSGGSGAGAPRSSSSFSGGGGSRGGGGGGGGGRGGGGGGGRGGGGRR